MLGHTLVIAAIVGSALRHLLSLGVKLAAAGGHLEALGRGGHRVAVRPVEGGLLLVELALLLVKLLLLEVVNLGVNGGNGVGGRRGQHVGGDGRVGDAGGHGGRVVLQQAVAAGDHARGVRVGHEGIAGRGGLTRLLMLMLMLMLILGVLVPVLVLVSGAGHHGLGAGRGAVVEAVKVKLHGARVGDAADAGHVEELVELIVGPRGHVLVLAFPGGRTHHGWGWVVGSRAPRWVGLRGVAARGLFFFFFFVFVFVLVVEPGDFWVRVLRCAAGERTRVSQSRRGSQSTGCV